MPLWIIATCLAAGIQTLRFILQRQVRDAGLSTGGATFSRFIFAAPLAIITVAVLQPLTATAWPSTTPAFWSYAFFGGLCQIGGTFATIMLFSLRNFAVGIAFTKTETIQVVLFSLLILGEGVSGAGLAAILVGIVGVILISSKDAGDTARWSGALRAKPMLLGLIAGAGFGLSAIGYRGAALDLDTGGALFRAACTLAAVTAMQTVTMGLWLLWREPGEVARVLRAWRRTALVGLTGMLGSLAWFTAFALQNAAYVRAVGQIELVLGVIVAWAVFGERVARREAIGIAFLGLSVVALMLVA
ncbi:MAG: DMT family transporter [Pseudomonadota bacterium]